MEVDERARSLKMCAVLVSMVMVGSIVCAVPSLAQSPSGDPPVSNADDDKARVFYLNGERLYNEGRYEEAVVAFQSAYSLSPRPLLLFNMANAYERLGKLQEAIDTLNKYRVFADPVEQDILLARVQTLETRLAQQRARVPLPDPQPVLPNPIVPHRRSPAPWVVAVGGGVLGLVGAGTAGLTWFDSRTLIEEGNEQGWNRLRPINNAGVIGGIAGGTIGVVGLSWGVARPSPKTP